MTFFICLLHKFYNFASFCLFITSSPLTRIIQPHKIDNLYKQTNLVSGQLLRHPYQQSAQTRLVVVVSVFFIIFVVDVVFVLSLLCLLSLYFFYKYVCLSTVQVFHKLVYQTSLLVSHQLVWPPLFNKKFKQKLLA